MPSFMQGCPPETGHNGMHVTTAAAFDHDLHTLSWAEAYARHAAQPERRALLSLYSEDEDVVSDAFNLLDALDSPLAYGIRLFAWVTRGEFERIEQAFMPLEGTDPGTLEGSMYALVAASVAAAELGQSQLGIARLHSVGVLAGLLGARHRQQWAALEQERQLLAKGQADVQRVRAAMALVTPTESRVWHARQIEGAALMARGEYRQAGEAAGDGLLHFVTVLRGEQIPPPTPDRSFGSLALGALQLVAEQDPGPAVADVVSEPDATYGWALRAGYALQQGQRFDLRQMPEPADQRALWGMLCWEALTRGDTRHSPEAIVTALRDGLSRMTSMEMLDVLMEYTPTALAALRMSPIAQLAHAAGPVMPLLVGEHVLWENEEEKLPGRTGGGIALLMQALGQDWPISRVERQRLRQAIAALELPAPLVLITDVVRALHALIPGGGDAWRIAAGRVTSEVRARAVRRVLIDQYALQDVVHG